jgi:hypothetical protein
MIERCTEHTFELGAADLSPLGEENETGAAEVGKSGLLNFTVVCGFIG